MELTYELLHELLHYDEEDGLLYWKPRDKKFFKHQSQDLANVWNNRFAGSQAGSIWKHNKHGVTSYRIVKIFGKARKAHRIIWWMCNGTKPIQFIDHIDHDGLNNRLENLREVSSAESVRNVPKYRSIKTKYIGVFEHKGWYKVRFLKKVYGNFATEELAHAVREKLQREEGFHPNHGK